MLSTGLHAYTLKKHNRRKELSVTLGFPYPEVHPTSSGTEKAFHKNKAEETGSHNAKSTSDSASTWTSKIKEKSLFSSLINYTAGKISWDLAWENNFRNEIFLCARDRQALFCRKVEVPTTMDHTTLVWKKPVLIPRDGWFHHIVSVP